MLIALRIRRRLFAGAARDQWDEARRGLSSREQRHVQWAFHFALAAGWAAFAVLWWPGMFRSLARQPARLERLRTQINDRYGPASPI